MGIAVGLEMVDSSSFWSVEVEEVDDGCSVGDDVDDDDDEVVVVPVVVVLSTTGGSDVVVTEVVASLGRTFTR